MEITFIESNKIAMNYEYELKTRMTKSHLLVKWLKNLSSSCYFFFIFFYYTHILKTYLIMKKFLIINIYYV